jgi:hypothetical protein
LHQSLQQIQTISSANGTIPVVCFECGPSTNGSTIDTYGYEMVSVVQGTVGTNGYFSALANWWWGYDGGSTNTNNNLVDSSGALNDYGTEVSAWIAGRSAYVV